MTNPKDRIGTTKVPLHLIPLSAQIPTCLALFTGEKKYERWNWRHEQVAASIYIDAALRHIQKWVHGQENDKETGIHHLGHAIAGLMILLDSQSYGNLIDDRPPSDNSAELLDDAQKDVIRLTELYGEKVPNTPPISPPASPVERVEVRRGPYPGPDYRGGPFDDRHTGHWSHCGEQWAPPLGQINVEVTSETKVTDWLSQLDGHNI
jgi:hypothetical protein